MNTTQLSLQINHHASRSIEDVVASVKKNRVCLKVHLVDLRERKLTKLVCLSPLSEKVRRVSVFQGVVAVPHHVHGQHGELMGLNTSFKRQLDLYARCRLSLIF